MKKEHSDKESPFCPLTNGPCKGDRCCWFSVESNFCGLPIKIEDLASSARNIEVGLGRLTKTLEIIAENQAFIGKMLEER